MYINLFKEPIDAVSTNQSKRLNKLHLIFLAKNVMLFMTLLNFTGTVLLIEFIVNFFNRTWFNYGLIMAPNWDDSPNLGRSAVSI